MHKKLKRYLKKSAAMFTAAALTFSAGSAIIWADGSYQKEEKKAFSKSLESLPKFYENLLEEYKVFNTGAEADFSIELEDAGRSMLNTSGSTDLSWLNKVEMQTKVIFKDGVEGVDMNVLLNDTHICNLQSYFDIYEQFSIIRKMPEIFDGYIRRELIPNTYDESGTSPSVTVPYGLQQFQNYMEVMMNLGDYLPEVSIAETLLERYGNILIDHISDTSSSEEVLTLEEISENCKVYEGRIYQEDLTALAEEILTTAKDDAELKKVLNTWEEITPDSPKLYQSFLKGIDDALTEIEEPVPKSEAENDFYISSKVWVSEDDLIIGRQISLVDGTGNDFVITWQMPCKNGKFEYLLDFASRNSRSSMTGNGKIDGSIMSGTYYLYSDSQPIICVEMEDYDVEAAKEGYGKGTYTITALPGISDKETYSILSDYSLIAKIESKKHNTTIALSLLNAGSVLGTLTIDSTVGSDIVIPEITDADKVYDTAVEEDNIALAEAISYDEILGNLRKAGVPEDMVADIRASIENGPLSGTNKNAENYFIEE